MDQFSEFWAVWPRKVCKKQSEKSWKAATKRADPSIIISAARRYAESRKGQDPTFTCHATTWLNGDRWEDWPAPQAKLPTADVDQLNATWIIKYGYAPWISESAVRRAIACGMLTKETAEEKGYRV